MSDSNILRTFLSNLFQNFMHKTNNELHYLLHEFKYFTIIKCQTII